MVHCEVSAIALCNSQGKILLQDRRSISKFGEEWGFFGGGVEQGETPEQAVRREAIEELEFKPKELIFLGKFSSSISQEDSVTVHLFFAPFPGFSSLNQHEGDGMKLFHIDEARHLKTMQSDSALLDCVQSFLKTYKKG